MTRTRTLILRAGSHDELHRWLGGLGAYLKQPQAPKAAIENQPAAVLRNLASMEHMPAAAAAHLTGAAFMPLTRVDTNALPAFAAAATALHAAPVVSKPQQPAEAAPPRPPPPVVSIAAPPAKQQQQQQQQPHPAIVSFASLGAQRNGDSYSCGADCNWLEDDFDT